MHPDKNPDRIKEATIEFQVLQRAHETLSDPQKKAEYDQSRTAATTSQNTTAYSNGAPPPTSEGNHTRSSNGSGFNSNDSDSNDSDANDSDADDSDANDFDADDSDANDSDANYFDENDSDPYDFYPYDSDPNDSPPAAKKPKGEGTYIPTGAIKAIKYLNLSNNRGTIRARVTNKTDVRTWSNEGGEGKYFKIDLLDGSGEILMTGFNNSVDSFYDMVQVNHVYCITWFTVKTANKQFTSIQHDYELTFNNDTRVTRCVEDTSDIPQQVTYDFVAIAGIENLDEGKIIDVIGLCKSVADCQNATVRNTGKVVKKRELVLMDQSGKEIALTLWEKKAEDFSNDTQPIIAMKGVKVSGYGGKSLSCLTTSLFKVNPDLEQARTLRQWYDTEGSSLPTESLSSARGGDGADTASSSWN